MILFCVVIQQVSPAGYEWWIEESWDEHSVDENPARWKEKLDEILAHYDDVRVMRVRIPDDALEAQFRREIVKGEVLEGS